MKIDPKKITDYHRTNAQLQAFWLFCILVAGKNSDIASRYVAKILAANKDVEPFKVFRELGEVGVHNTLVAHRVGQYNRVTKAIMQSLDLDLRTCTVDDLMSVFGVGPKTSRFFLLHTRPNIEVAVLDIHILKWLRSHFIDTPKNTPNKKADYEHFEKMFIQLRQYHYPHLSPAEADLIIWMEQSGRLDDEGNVSKEFDGE